MSLGDNVPCSHSGQVVPTPAENWLRIKAIASGATPLRHGEKSGIPSKKTVRKVEGTDHLSRETRHPLGGFRSHFAKREGKHQHPTPLKRLRTKGEKGGTMKT